MWMSKINPVHFRWESLGVAFRSRLGVWYHVPDYFLLINTAVIGTLVWLARSTNSSIGGLNWYGVDNTLTIWNISVGCQEFKEHRRKTSELTWICEESLSWQQVGDLLFKELYTSSFTISAKEDPNLILLAESHVMELVHFLLEKRKQAFADAAF